VTVVPVSRLKMKCMPFKCVETHVFVLWGENCLLLGNFSRATRYLWFFLATQQHTFFLCVWAY
jgi:hypothetical protein